MNPNQPNNNINSVQVNFPTVNPGGNLYPNLNPNPAQGGFGNANPLNSPIAQLGLTYGTGYFNQQQQRLQNTIVKNFTTLKYYYNVNNSYVINKIKLLLFPIRHKYWKRSIQRLSPSDTMGIGNMSVAQEVYLPPREDINAPDLYIPTMAFITYILLIGFVMGANFRFTPEVLGKTATQGFVVWLFELFIIKFGFYLLNSLTVPIFDVVAYSGYKYVGIVLTVIAGILFGQYAYYSLFLFTSVCMAVFLVKTLKLVFPEVQTGYSAPSSRRNYFLLGIGALQFLEFYYLSYGTASSSDSNTVA